MAIQETLQERTNRVLDQAQQKAQEQRALAGLIAELTEAREDYRTMAAQGHQGLAGWCIARAARLDREIEKFFQPTQPQGQEQQAQPGQPAQGPKEVLL